MDFFGADLEGYDFRGRRVLDLTPADGTLARWILARGANGVVVCSESISPDQAGLVQADSDVWHIDETDIDVAFVDTRQLAGFDHVGDAARLLQLLRRVLARDGQCFIVMRNGYVESNWDLFNAVLATPTGRMYSSMAMFDDLLREWSVRTMRETGLDDDPHEQTRVFRISPKRPTLLVILGQSGAGKTSLGRSFKEINPGGHTSSDYAYINLVKTGAATSPRYGEHLQHTLGEATAAGAGSFFRALEADLDAFREYLDLLLELLPPNRSVVSMDLDLRREDRIEVMREHFDAAGYSVWFVRR